MNVADRSAARRRIAGPDGDPGAIGPPRWRPFQLAFILLNLAGLHRQARTTIARSSTCCSSRPAAARPRPISASPPSPSRIAGSSAGGVLGAGVSVIMRYTLRLLTLDQLVARRRRRLRAGADARRSGVRDANGGALLGDWPIEIGLWVGSDASPNILGGTRQHGRRHGGRRGCAAIERTDKRRAGADQGVSLVRHARSRATVVRLHAERRTRRRTWRSAAPTRPATSPRDRPLPILTVDEAIYRRLPAFLIATVDKFAGLPWVGEAGAFFGHVDRYDERRLLRRRRAGRRHSRSATTDASTRRTSSSRTSCTSSPGRSAPSPALYETAIDRLCRAQFDGERVRPKIVASTATVRRADDADPRRCSTAHETAVFPPPGIERTRQLLRADRAVERKPGAPLPRPRRARAAARSSSSCAP